MSLNWYLLLVFILSLLANVLSLLMFLARVHWPGVAGLLGNLALAMGVPALVVAIVGALAGLGVMFWLMPLLYAAFCLFGLIVDVILNVEFRQPRRPAILVPFLVLFYVSLIGMWGMLWQLGFVPWALVGVVYFGMLGSSFYALGKGVG